MSLILPPEHTYFRLNVYQGCTAYIDNLALIDPAGIEVVRFDFDEPVNFKGSAYEQKGIAKTKAASAALYSKMVAATAAKGSDNYAVLVDNSSGTGYDSFWMTALGYESPNLPSGEKYTISFDWYAEKVGSTNNGSLRVGKAHWDTNTVIGACYRCAKRITAATHRSKLKVNCYGITTLIKRLGKV